MHDAPNHVELQNELHELRQELQDFMMRFRHELNTLSELLVPPTAPPYSVVPIGTQPAAGQSATNNDFTPSNDHSTDSLESKPFVERPRSTGPSPITAEPTFATKTESVVDCEEQRLRDLKERLGQMFRNA
ncbi:MAG: hypothetical protein KDA87_06190 [Planctomycetales bacterium]|nr:hypothetical protein [Planctomycetales bacterium]